VDTEDQARMTKTAAKQLRRLAIAVLLAAGNVVAQTSPRQQGVVDRGDSVSVQFIDVDLRVAVQALARYLDRPVVIGQVTNVGRVTLETPKPVLRTDVLRLLRGLVESQGLEFVIDSAASLYRVRTRDNTQRAAAPDPSSRPSQLAGTPAELFVLRLHHARAADVASTVNALFGRGSALGERSVQQTRLGAASTLAQDLERNGAGSPGNAPAQNTGPGSAAAPRGASLTGEATIIPDASTNALFVRANRADVELIKTAVAALDVRPLQVLIEVIIAEVRKDRGFSIGTDSRMGTTPIGPNGQTATASNAGPGLGDFVVKVMSLGRIDADATLRVGASKGDVVIASRPVIIATNNELAEINVGSQRPFISVSRSLPTDTPQRDQTVEYKDVGTKLSVRPTVSSDGFVQLEVTQQINAATSETAFNAPVISTRSVSTHLLIKDGQTVVLGGLTDHQRDNSSSGLPFLSRIPILGGLLGGQARRTTDTELFIFITPRVLYSDDDAQRESDNYRKRAGADGRP